jgi:hypothetical protein
MVSGGTGDLVVITTLGNRLVTSLADREIVFGTRYADVPVVYSDCDPETSMAVHVRKSAVSIFDERQ